MLLFDKPNPFTQTEVPWTKHERGRAGGGGQTAGVVLPDNILLDELFYPGEEAGVYTYGALKNLLGSAAFGLGKSPWWDSLHPALQLHLRMAFTAYVFDSVRYKIGFRVYTRGNYEAGPYHTDERL